MRIFNNYSKPNYSTIEQNNVNGFDAERFCSAMLTLALNSRISWASRTEDNSKIDLIATYVHPWIKNKVDTILIQVKSGETFAKTYTNDSNQTGLKIKEKFGIHLFSNHHQLICWINREENNIYWFLIKSNSQFYRKDYGLSHELSPATRFDITRILMSFNNKDGGSGIHFKALEKNHLNYRALRSKAKLKYLGFRTVNIVSPLLGKVEFTKFGWRYITRESRLAIYKFSSMEIMPVLDKIITRTPSKHYIQNQKKQNYNGHTNREIEYLLEYDKIRIHQGEINIKVYVKLVEFIQHPVNWSKCAILNQKIKRRVVFKSVYYKKMR